MGNVGADRVRCRRGPLELDEIPHGHVERPGDADEHIDADVGRSDLDLPEVGAADARHKGELLLGDAVLGADGPDVGAQTPLFAYILHSASIRAVISDCALCSEHLVEKGYAMRKALSLGLAVLFALCIVGCSPGSGSGSSGPDYADDEVISALARGLESRFEVADEHEALGVELSSDYYGAAIQAELDVLLPYKDRPYEDSSLQEAVLAYINTLQESMEVTEEFPVDSIEFIDQWNAAYDERTRLLKQFVDEYGLEVSDKYEDALSELLINGNAVARREETDAAIEALASSMVFEQQSDGYGFYTYTATVQNTSGLNLEDVSLVLSLYDAEGVMVEEAYASVSSWPNGETVRFEAFGGTNAAQIKVNIDYYTVAS